MTEPLTVEEAKNKIARYCAYQERNKREVREKLRSYGLKEEDCYLLLDFLEEEDFLNEERYVDTYVRSKFKLKKWGRLKIQQNLKSKDLPLSLIKYYLGCIDEEDYRRQYEELALKKASLVRSGNDLFGKRKKVLNYLLSKGYELQVIQDYCMRMPSDSFA